MKFVYHSGKMGRQHIVGMSGRVLCGAYTDVRPLELYETEIPCTRRLFCQDCRALAMGTHDRGKKKRKKKAHRRKQVNLYDDFYTSPEWKRARYDALRASNGRCQLCDQTNLQVLCGDCNHGKGNRDSTDWRRPF